MSHRKELTFLLQKASAPFGSVHARHHSGQNGAAKFGFFRFADQIAGVNIFSRHEKSLIKMSGSTSSNTKNNYPKTPWPHAPLHQLSQRGVYFVTVGTYLKHHHFHGKKRLGVLHRGLLTVAGEFGWRFEAWAVFANHYHFVAHSPESAADAASLSPMLGRLHEKTAKWINKLDQTPGRQVWHNFRETRLTYEKSYLARLNYTHQNPVKHGLVLVANQYPWCSAAWFERTATPAQVKTIYSFKADRLQLVDDYEVSADW